MRKVLIAGGGLTGLVVANLLARAEIDCTVIEKKQYPFHRVCGEYISNETMPFLKSVGLFPSAFEPPQINHFQITSVNGKSAALSLDLGGFGISRFSFDQFLYEKAKSVGVDFILNTEVDSIRFGGLGFEVVTLGKTFQADVVVGAFGKRSKLDVFLNRDFIHQRSPYLGVKYHIRTTHPHDLIALHNFEQGYCGISNIEDGKSCLCYLSHRSNLKRFGNIKSMEEEVLYKNPFLKSLFLHSEFLFDRPETINEISFETKNPVEGHVMMGGDAAGMITPLCGNGMALAIHSAKILSALITDFCQAKISRDAMEKTYTHQWNLLFAKRLRAGRQIQNLFGGAWASNFAVNLARYCKPVANFLVSKTHGDPF